MTSRWWKNTEPLYRRFAGDGFVGRDADEACAMFSAETFGGEQPDIATNRYASGKRNMDITVSMWADDIPRGLLMKYELLEDKTFGGVRWWIERILSRILGGPNALRREKRP